MKYDDMIREDLIAEIKALHLTIDKRVNQKTKKERESLNQQMRELELICSRELELLCVEIASRSLKDANTFLAEKRGSFFGFPSCLSPILHRFGVSPDIPFNLSYHMNELQKEIDKIKKGA